MKNSNGPVIDMTPEGNFIEPPKPSILTYLLRLALFGVALAMVAALFWTFLLVLPLFILAALIAGLLFRAQLRRSVRRF